MAQYGCARINQLDKIMTYFRTIASLANGLHKIMRLDRSQVAHAVSEFRKAQVSPFMDGHVLKIGEDSLDLKTVLSLKFLNEWTGEEYLTVN